MCTEESLGPGFLFVALLSVSMVSLSLFSLVLLVFVPAVTLTFFLLGLSLSTSQQPTRLVKIGEGKDGERLYQTLRTSYTKKKRGGLKLHALALGVMRSQKEVEGLSINIGMPLLLHMSSFGSIEEVTSELLHMGLVLKTLMNPQVGLNTFSCVH